MKKIYQLVCTSLFLIGSFSSCDDGRLSHNDVYIPDPVEESDEDDGYSSEPTTNSILRIQTNVENRHQEIDGFGCSFGWMEAVYGCTQRNQIMDDLYSDNGLRFNIYRGEIMNSSLQSDGSFNYYENDNFQYAADSPEFERLWKTDPKFKHYAQLWCVDRTSKIRDDIYYFFSVWTPPIAWKKTDGSEDVTGGNGSFNSEYSAAYADFLASFGKAFKDKFGINVYGISGWNEPDQAMGGWNGCTWENQQMADFTCDYLRPALNAKGLNNTKIIYGELPWWSNAITWVEQSLNNNPKLADAGIVAAGHGYSTIAKNIKPMQAAEEKGVHVWQTETCDDKSRDETWNDAMKWAQNYQGYLMDARVNAIVWWAGARYCTSTGENLLQTNTWDLSTSYYRVDRYYSIGQFSRYIPRGSYRMDVEKISDKDITNGLPRELTASAYIKNDTYTIVLVNNSKTRAFDARVEIEGKEFRSMISYISSSSVKWLRKKLNPSLSGKRTVTVPKYSVVTITGKFREKGTQTDN
jgi:O-glycosyl hydrolase